MLKVASVHFSERLPDEFAQIQPKIASRLRAQLLRHLRGTKTIRVKQEIEGAKSPKTRNSIQLTLKSPTSAPDESPDEIALAIARICHYVWATQEVDDDGNKGRIDFVIEHDKTIRGKRARPTFSLPYDGEDYEDDDELAADVSYEVLALQRANEILTRQLEQMQVFTQDLLGRLLEIGETVATAPSHAQAMQQQAMEAWIASSKMVVDAAKMNFDRSKAEAEAEAGVKKWDMVWGKIEKAGPFAKWAFGQIMANRNRDKGKPGDPGYGRQGKPAAPPPNPSPPSSGQAPPPPPWEQQPAQEPPTELDEGASEEPTADEVANPLRTLVRSFVLTLRRADHRTMTEHLDAQQIGKWWTITDGKTDAEIYALAQEHLTMPMGLALSEWRKGLADYQQEQLEGIYSALLAGPPEDQEPETVEGES